MKNIVDPRVRPNRLDAARMTALRLRITKIHDGCLPLTAQMYCILREAGFSRRDVDRAIDALVAANEVVIEVNAGGVLVRLDEAREGGE